MIRCSSENMSFILTSAAIINYKNNLSPVIKESVI